MFALLFSLVLGSCVSPKNSAEEKKEDKQQQAGSEAETQAQKAAKLEEARKKQEELERQKKIKSEQLAQKLEKEGELGISAQDTSYRTIAVVFPVELSSGKSEDSANYTVVADKPDHPGVKGIAVQSAKLDDTKKIVTLTVSKRLISMPYTVTVKQGLKYIQAGKDKVLPSLSSKFEPQGTRMIFVSEKLSTGNMMERLTEEQQKSLKPEKGEGRGVAAAHLSCNLEAKKAGLSGDYKALLLSTNLKTKKPSFPDFLKKDSTYIRPDGLGAMHLFKADTAWFNIKGVVLPPEMLANGLRVPMETEFEKDGLQEVVKLLSYAAFSGYDREYDEPMFCGEDKNEWLESGDDYPVSTNFFRSISSNYLLGADNDTFCDQSFRLMCAQVEKNTMGWVEDSKEVLYSGDQFVFLSSIETNGNIGKTVKNLRLSKKNNGILNADLLCQHMAKNANYEGDSEIIKKNVRSVKENFASYKAMLSSFDHPDGSGKELHLIDRLKPLKGAYHLLNGYKVVENAADMVDPLKGAQVPINVTENGLTKVLNPYDLGDNEHESFDELVFTGTELGGRLSGDTVIGFDPETYEEHIVHYSNDCRGWTADKIRDSRDVEYGSMLGEHGFSSVLSLSYELSTYCSWEHPIYCIYAPDKKE